MRSRRAPGRRRIPSSSPATARMRSAARTRRAKAPSRRKLIEDRPLLRPGEVLELVPGLIVTQHSGDGKANQYFLRGFNLDHGTDFATCVAGMPVNMPLARARPGLHRPQLPDPRTGRRASSTARARTSPRTAISPPPASARIAYVTELDAAVRLRDRRRERLPAPARRRLDGGRARHAARRARSRPQQRSLGRARGLPQGQRRAALVGVGRQPTARRHGDGLPARSGPRPTRFRSARSTADARPLRLARSDRRRQDRARQPVAGLDARASATGAFQMNAYVMRSRLDLFSNFTFQLTHPFDLGDPIDGDQFRRPSGARLTGLNAARSWDGALGEAAMTNRLGVQLRYDRIDPLGAVPTRCSATAPARSAGRREGGQRRRCSPRTRCSGAVAAQRRRPALRPLHVLGRQRQPGQLGQASAPTSLRPSSR